MKIKYLIFYLMVTFSLSSCVIPVVRTNRSVQQFFNKDYKIPFAKTADMAQVFLVHPYLSIEWQFAGMGSTGDGSAKYLGSTVFLMGPHGKRYVGNSDDDISLCFNAKPGKYELLFENGKDNTPKTIRVPLALRNKRYYFALSGTSFTSSTYALKFSQLTKNKAGYYLTTSAPLFCPRATDLPRNESIPAILNLTIKNASRKNYWLYQFSQTELTYVFVKKLMPHEQYTLSSTGKVSAGTSISYRISNGNVNWTADESYGAFPPALKRFTLNDIYNHNNNFFLDLFPPKIPFDVTQARCQHRITANAVLLNCKESIVDELPS